MGNVRTRKETGKLYLDFNYRAVRCREQTALPDTPANRKRVKALLEIIEAKILLGEFDYAEYFPNSRNLKKFAFAQEHPGQPETPGATRASEATPETPDFESFAWQWFEESRVLWRKSHARNITSILSSALVPSFGKMKVGQITKTDILNFRTKRASRPGRNGQPSMAPKTVNSQMAILRAILAEAAERYDFQTPYKNIKPLKLRRTHIEPFSIAEVNRITAAVREDFRNYYIVRFYSGMRTGEIDGLKWKHVDFDNREILIRETLVNGSTEYTKTDGSQREIPMLGPVYEALREQYQATGRKSPYVFCNRQGEPLDHGNVTKRVWYPLLRHLGLTKRRPYQTRHTAATLLLASGENPEWVARLLGHASTEMLFKVYSRYIPNLTRMDGSAFERLVSRMSDTAGEKSDDSE